MKVNITMICHNRPALTEQSIHSLYKNTPKELFDLTVVDDASTDEAMEPLLDKLKEEYGFYLWKSPTNQGTGGARNLTTGLVTSQGRRAEFLYFSDNDVYFQPYWLQTLLVCFQDAERHGIKVLGGYCHPFQGTEESIAGVGGYKYNVKAAIGLLSWLLRWETWDRFGTLHDHAKGVCQSEDWEYVQRIRKEGYKVAVLSPAVIENTGKTNSFGDLSVGHETASPEVEGVEVL